MAWFLQLPESVFLSVGVVPLLCMGHVFSDSQPESPILLRFAASRGYAAAAIAIKDRYLNF